MSNPLNITTAAFGGLREVTTAPLWQYDYGQILKITGLDLPQAFEVHFSNSRKSGETVTQIGTDNQVVIPDMYLTSGADIYCFIFLHDGLTDGETEYVIKIPVRERPEPSDIEPTPEQQDAITEAIAALNVAVTQTGEDKAATAALAEAAAASSLIATEAATQAQGSANSASGSASTASTAASTATTKASEAATSATNAASAKTAAETAETNARAAQIASESAQASAESAAQTATTKATEAAASAASVGEAAQTATAKAAEASASATSASGSATAAATSASTASTKASEASASATAANTAKTAAEAAQAAAEEVLESIPSDYSTLNAEVDDLDDRVETLESRTGFTETAIDLLDAIGNVIAFTSATGGQLWDDLVSELRNPTPAARYSITFTGDNYDSSNSATSIGEGRAYETIISPVEGYLISAITATMGNEAITPTDNGDGTYTVSIASVTADISISVATAVDPGDIMFHVENLVCDGTQTPIETPLQFSSNAANGVANDWTLCARVKTNERNDYKYAFATAGSGGSRLALDTYVAGTTSRIWMVGENQYGHMQSMINNSVSVVITHTANDTKKLTCTFIDKDTGEITVLEKTSRNGVNDLNYNSAETPLIIGSKAGGTSAFIGTIEDITIYNRILTAEEISAYIQGGNA